MSRLRHPLRTFKALKRRYKILSLSGLLVFAMGGTALAFYLLGLTGSGSGSIGINGAGNAPIASLPLQAVITPSSSDGKLDIGSTNPVGVWLSNGDTPIPAGQYQVTSLTTDPTTGITVSGPNSGCQASWFDLSNWTPNPMWGTDGDANDGPGSGSQFPEVFSVQDTGTFQGGASTNYGENGTFNGFWSIGAASESAGTTYTNPNWATSQPSSALTAGVAQDPASVFTANKYWSQITTPLSSTDFELGQATVSFTNQDVDQNACDGDTLTINVTMAGS